MGLRSDSIGRTRRLYFRVRVELEGTRYASSDDEASEVGEQREERDGNLGEGEPRTRLTDLRKLESLASIAHSPMIRNMECRDDGMQTDKNRCRFTTASPLPRSSMISRSRLRRFRPVEPCSRAKTVRDCALRNARARRGNGLNGNTIQSPFGSANSNHQSRAELWPLREGHQRISVRSRTYHRRRDGKLTWQPIPIAVFVFRFKRSSH